MNIREKIVTNTTAQKKEHSASNTQKSEFSPSTSSPVDQILYLQRTIGNQAVQRLIKSGMLQKKLRIGKSNDIYEQKANRLADQVMRPEGSALGVAMPDPGLQRQPEAEEEESIQTKPLAEQITPLVQRQAEPEKEEEIEEESEEEEETVQTKKKLGTSSSVSLSLRSRMNSLKGGGRPLSGTERSFFEPRFGYDFSQVHVHTGSRSTEIDRLINTKAFTTGRDIIFRGSYYAPDSSTGKRLLAHELTHTIQQEAAPIAKGLSIQRTYRTARQRGQTGNPINVAVQAVRGNYSGIGATWLTTHLVAGIIYAEGEINMDVTDVIGDWVGSSDTVGPGQLSSVAIQQVDTSIPRAAHQQFEAQFGAAPATWREKAEHDQWAFFYSAAYLAWCMTRAAQLFQAVDGADSHIPLGFAYYKGAFPTIRDLRRRIARERGIANTDVTWEMIEEAAGRGASRRLSPRERQAFEYVQLGVGGFDFDFRINNALESRWFHVPEGHVKVFCSANYTDTSITPAPSDSYDIQLMELRILGQYTEFPQAQAVEHNRVRFRIGQRQVYEWTRLPRGSNYALKFINDNPNEIRGSGEVKYLY